jgi:hypothetical protein
MNPNIPYLALLFALMASGCTTVETGITAAGARTPKTTFDFDGINTGTVPDDWSVSYNQISLMAF